MICKALSIPPGLIEIQRTLFPAVRSTFSRVNTEKIGRLINVEGNAFVRRCLTEEEIGKFNNFKYLKRRDEWLAGRIAAKAAGAYFFGKKNAGENDLIAYRVDNDQDGKPRLHADNADDKIMPEISISHSKGLAIAMAAASESCGLDVQKITNTLSRVREKFITAEEHTLIMRDRNSPDDEITFLALIWSAKEAIRKKHGRQPLPGFLEITLSAQECIDDSAKVLNFMVTARKKPQVVFAFRQNDYSCAYCL